MSEAIVPLHGYRRGLTPRRCLDCGKGAQHTVHLHSRAAVKRELKAQRKASELNLATAELAVEKGVNLERRLTAALEALEEAQGALRTLRMLAVAAEAGNAVLGDTRVVGKTLPKHIRKVVDAILRGSKEDE